MLSQPEASHIRMVQVRALSGGFPFSNRVETDPPQAWKELQSTSGLLLDPTLMQEFGVRRGDRLKLGSAEFRVLGSLQKGVPRSSRFSGFAPEIFMRELDLEATGLTGIQSLVHYHKAIELTAQTEADKAKALSEIRRVFTEAGVQIQTPENRKESIGEEKAM
jgi:putative ABC transport system permease protein